MKLLVGNWKLNTPNLEEWKTFSAPKNVEVVICPPFPYFAEVKKNIKTKLGAQDVFWEESGAFTGEVSPGMLKERGAEYVIIGHSERRHWLGETDEMINKKVRTSQKAGLNVILCVGESGEIRKKGIDAAKEFVANQLKKDLTGLKSSVISRKSELIVAYEPIWAIGTGNADKPEDSAEMAEFIKKTLSAKPYTLNPKVLYGGSVNSQNAKAFLVQKDIDGALVGGASLDPKEFQKIAEIASRV